jgi:hypothetical protein
MQQGNALETYNNVPDNIQQRLYAAEQQQYKQYYKTANKSNLKFPSIVIKNVLLGLHSDTLTQTA